MPCCRSDILSRFQIVTERKQRADIQICHLLAGNVKKNVKMRRCLHRVYSRNLSDSNPL